MGVDFSNWPPLEIERHINDVRKKMGLPPIHIAPSPDWQRIEYEHWKMQVDALRRREEEA